MMETENFTVEYQLERRTERECECVAVTPRVSLATGEQLLAVGSLEVDGIELIPSSKLLFLRERSLEMPEVKVFRPVAGRRYSFRLTLRVGDGTELSLVSELVLK